jgi:hypothetical protein
MMEAILEDQDHEEARLVAQLPTINKQHDDLHACDPWFRLAIISRVGTRYDLRAWTDEYAEE